MFKPGDIVRVVEKYLDDDVDGLWNVEMDDIIGEEVVIHTVLDSTEWEYNIYIEHESGFPQEEDDEGNGVYGWYFPSKCLELVRRAGQEIIFKSKVMCPNCKVECQDHYSEYVGGMIKKCKCGWC